MKEEITIAGMKVGLRLLGKGELKGIPIDAALGYHFYEAQFRGYPFLLLEARSQRKLSPLQYFRLAGHIQTIKGLPCVFLFQSLPTYERNRLIERGVYFVAGEKYVFLPFLLVNAREGKAVKTDKLLPAAQYLLLHHLQVRDLSGESLMTLEQILPYKYVTLSRAVRQSEAMGLLESHAGAAREKILHFPLNKERLWDDAEPLMQNPVKVVHFADEKPDGGLLGGINALAHYSSLNPEDCPAYAISEEQFRRLRKEGRLQGLNPIEGNVKIEVWKYPPIPMGQQAGLKVVDKLSLYLTLKDEQDPRVEKELEHLMQTIWSKD